MKMGGVLILFFMACLLFFASCGYGVQRISPSGLLYATDNEEEETWEYCEDCCETLYEQYVIEPIDQPQNNTIQDDGVLRLHMRPPLTLNPLLNEDVTVARILQLIFEPLAVLDNEFRIVGHLAYLEFASDFGSVNATIREGAIWSDGMPVTADDVIFSIEFLKNAPNAAIYKNNVSEIADAIRIDSRTVQIIFTRASVMAGYSLNFPIIPQHWQDENNMNPIGSGPFIFESLNSTRSMTLRRNPHNFRAFGGGVQEVEVIFLPNSETDFHAFERGRIDAIHLSLTEWTRHAGIRSPNYEVFPAMYFEFIGFNFTRSIFREVHTRQGIAHAFNANDAVASLYLAHAVRTATPIHPFNRASDNSVSAPIYDPARAAALLGTVRISEPLVVLANAENTQRASIAKRLAESLTNAGLSSVAEIVPSEEYFARLDAHDFDLFVGGMKLPFAPAPQIFFQGGGMFIHDFALETAHSALMFASTEVAYTQAMSHLQQAFTDHLPIISLAFKHSAILSNPRISSTLEPAPDHVFLNVHEWNFIP
ncbi:MAG: ABC transporter substrate-binding protein [Defluviitaleaceae bacterium]|nr:ABC transporter substrate-binding protein [Defluviitaleaceae bacterium]